MANVVRNEYWDEFGALYRFEQWDFDAGVYTVEEPIGSEIENRTITQDEYDDYYENSIEPDPDDMPWRFPVVSRVSAPPGSPDIGDRHIVKPTGSGDWAGEDHSIAQWDGSAWSFIVPTDGYTAWANASDEIWVFQGSLWIKVFPADHGALDGLGDDDHTQYLNESRHDGLAADNPHSVTVSQSVAADSGTDITTTELETLSDASNADALHGHAHSALSGIGTDDHHAEDHTIASHSDTTATGAELETLTDGSNADTLHSHAPIDGADHNSLTNLTTGDPHTQYQKESEKGAASGYASLDGTTKVPTAELGTGTADNTKFLRGDRVWADPGGGGGGSRVWIEVTNQTMTNAQDTEVLWNSTPIFDGSGGVLVAQTNGVKVTQAAKVLIMINLCMRGGGTTYLQMNATKNGTLQADESVLGLRKGTFSTGSNRGNMHVVDVLDCAASDVVSAYFSTDDGDNVDLTALESILFVEVLE